MSKVKEHIQLGNKELTSRLVIPPMATNKANADGTVTLEIVEYYANLTRNDNFSLVILEHACVEERGRCSSNQFSLSADDKTESFRKLVEAIHNNHKTVIAQINHSGAKGYIEETNVSPSKIHDEIGTLCRVKYLRSEHELTKEEIEDITDKFAAAAVRAKEAGFDGVELHSAHGFLLNQFYSVYTNKRQDEYGGSVKNRVRIHTEIVKKIREKLGKDFIIAVRLGTVDFIEGGSTLTDAVEASAELEKAGIDLLDISGGLTGYTREGREEPGYFSDITSEIKKNVSIPVILTGGFTTLSQAENFLEDGKADLIGIGRAVLKDHNWNGKG